MSRCSASPKAPSTPGSRSPTGWRTRPTRQRRTKRSRPPRTVPDTVGISEEQWAAAVGAIRTAVAADDRILLVCHVNPDGDALGSMLGIGQALLKLGASAVEATFPPPFVVPEPFEAMPGKQLLTPRPGPADFMITLDAASESRLGAYADRLGTVATVVLDHHASFTGFGTYPL